ncbi:AbiH family protein [Leucobacter sp. HY1910]
MYSTQPKPKGAVGTNNVMVLVGNGFDLQVLHEYGRETTTSYVDFFHFLMMKKVSKSNLVVEQMAEAFNSKPRSENWSDIEAGIEKLVADGKPIEDIRASVQEIQHWFAEFLNYVVDTDLLTALSSDTVRMKWTERTLGKFLRDIKNSQELSKVPFGMRRGNYELYNFQFVNFNYTSILDNYIYMDSEQFKPLPNSTVDTNFWFDTNPRDFAGEIPWNYSHSVFLECQPVIHPHGFQNTPRSLLFGIDGDGMSRDAVAKVSKSYWARVEQRYSHMFNETALFVIFGCSMGVADAWWWSNIAKALLADEAYKVGLMIYKWNGSSDSKLSDDEVTEEFFAGAKITDPGEKMKLARKIAVVSYTDSEDRIFLSTKREEVK